jgi:acetyltransferase-like isoleucine patch superfamily enzyme
MKYSNSLIQFIRYQFLKGKYANIDSTTFVSPRAQIYGSRGISLGPRVMIYQYANLQCTRWAVHDEVAGSISIGEGTFVQPHSYLWTCGGDIRIGRFCSVNPYCVLYGLGGLTIGDHVRIATHTVVVPANHNFMNSDIPIVNQGQTMEGIVVGDDVWVGAGVRILDGVEIGKGCVIAAGSVVTKSTIPYGIYAGVPAKKVKDRENVVE